MNNRWLEPVLERDLARVTAPEELWNRVQLPREQPARRPSLRLVWALAAAALILAVVSLRGSRSQLEFHSRSASAIQAWIKANSGLNLDLPAQASASVQLLGAHIVPGSSGAVEVSYRAGQYEARLLLSKDSGGASAIRHSVTHPAWSINGQRYLLSCADPAGLQIACLLCHPAGARDIALN